MRYVEARIEEYNREEAYRFYVTRSLQLGPQNRYITASLEDIIHPPEQDMRSGEDILIDTMVNAGLSFG